MGSPSLFATHPCATSWNIVLPKNASNVTFGVGAQPGIGNRRLVRRDLLHGVVLEVLVADRVVRVHAQHRGHVALLEVPDAVVGEHRPARTRRPPRPQRKQRDRHDETGAEFPRGEHPSRDGGQEVVVQRSVEDVAALLERHGVPLHARVMAGGGLQRLRVVERNLVEDDVRDDGVRGADERLAAAGALLEVEPDHRQPRLGVERVHDLRDARRLDAGRRGQPAGDNPWNARTPEWLTTSPPLAAIQLWLLP